MQKSQKSKIYVTFDSVIEIKIVLSVKRISFMLFKQKHLEGIKAGTVTLAFRKWKSTQLKRGSLLKTDVGIVEITDIAIINEPHINEIDAQKAGFINLESLMKSIYSAEIGKIYKIHVRFLKETQAKKIKEKISLSQSEIDSYKAKLLQMDKYARNGFWTKDILTSIKDNPKLSATQLSLKTGKTKEWLTQSIRKLKNIGLTVSLDPGYDLTPTGKLLMEHL